MCFFTIIIRIKITISIGEVLRRVLIMFINDQSYNYHYNDNYNFNF